MGLGPLGVVAQCPAFGRPVSWHHTPILSRQGRNSGPPHIMSGITYGFSIGAIGTLPIFDISVRNLQSAFQLPHVIDTMIRKELALGRIIGPYQIVPSIPNYRISPLGVVPKKVPGEFRVIHHLSYPQGASIVMVTFSVHSRLMFTEYYPDHLL